MSDLFIHVEEPSMEVALGALRLTLLGSYVGSVHVINHASKRQLMDKLPARLAGYRNMPGRPRVLVLLDRDDDDCRTLKRGLEQAALQAKLHTKSAPDPNGQFAVVNRIVVEELEAWFFGDVEALRATFPKLPASLANKAAYRDPDAIKGGTWEALHRELKSAGYYADSPMPKVEVARRVAPHMDPARNRSPSFQTFVSGLQALCR